LIGGFSKVPVRSDGSQLAAISRLELVEDSDSIADAFPFFEPSCSMAIELRRRSNR
jgi:hypothetical protein